MVGNTLRLTSLSLLSIDERLQRLGSVGVVASHVKALPTCPKVGRGKLDESRCEHEVGPWSDSHCLEK